MASVSYISRDWHFINIVMAFMITIVFLLLLLFLPESPRFLISNKNYEECYKLLKQIAKVNKRTEQMFTREQFFKQIDSNQNGTIENELNELNFHEIQSLLSIKVKSKSVENENLESEMDFIEKHEGSVFFFLMNPIKNLVITFLMCYVWMSMNMIYIGGSLGNFYKLFSFNK